MLHGDKGIQKADVLFRKGLRRFFPNILYKPCLRELNLQNLYNQYFI